MAPYDAMSTVMCLKFFGSKTCIFKKGQIQTYFMILMVLLTCLHHQASGMLMVSAITFALVAKWLSHFMAQLKVYRFYFTACIPMIAAAKIFFSLSLVCAVRLKFGYN